VEVDALEPAVLRQLVEAAILRHVDQRMLEVTRVAEASERAVLARVSAFVRRSGRRGAP
jgi:hypothetical protein